jgi:hypothetical protein
MSKLVIVVFDKDGHFFQVWTSDYKDGDGIQHGKKIAENIKGTYKVVSSY